MKVNKFNYVMVRIYSMKEDVFRPVLQYLNDGYKIVSAVAGYDFTEYILRGKLKGGEIIMTGRTLTKMDVDTKKAAYIDLVKNWEAETPEIIANRWKISKFAVQRMANILRKKGLPLSSKLMRPDDKSIFNNEFLDTLKKEYILPSVS